MKKLLTPKKAKEIKKWREERRQENKKRYKAFLKTETGRAYKKYDEVFGGVAVYQSARGVYIDNQALANLYLDAIEKGVPLGASDLEQSDSNHLSKVIEKAEAGDKEFQSCLGTMYYQGDGVSIDYEKAFYWVKKAAAQEHINAMYNLGYMYWSGEGTLEDYEEAFYWLSKAAEQRFAPAQNYLGMMYRDGRGVDEDFEEAFIWFSIAAEQGNSEAQCNLALMYIEGNGVPESQEEAGRWVNLANKQDSEFAAEMIDEYELRDYIWQHKI